MLLVVFSTYCSFFTLNLVIMLTPENFLECNLNEKSIKLYNNNKKQNKTKNIGIFLFIVCKHILIENFIWIRDIISLEDHLCLIALTNTAQEYYISRWQTDCFLVLDKTFQKHYFGQLQNLKAGRGNILVLYLILLLPLYMSVSFLC